MSGLGEFWAGQCQRWRQQRLRRRFAQLGAGGGAHTLQLCGRSPRLEIAGAVELGEHVSFRGVTRISSIHVAAGASLKIGAYSYFNQGINMAVTHGLTLGRRCLVAEAVSFFDTNYHEVDEGAGVLSGPIVVGDNVWIGHSATLLPGTKIGDHSVVGAGAVVRGEFPTRSLIVGVPAKLVREIRCSDNFFRR